MSYFLHLDTSDDAGSVAISRNGTLICRAANAEARNQASTVNATIADLLAEAGIGFSDLTAVVVCAGPGSYTGLRIGLSTAKGLCYALDIPLLLDNKITLLAYQAITAHGAAYRGYLPVLLAREGEYFVGLYNNKLEAELEPKHITELELLQILEDNSNLCIISTVISTEIMEKHTENNYVGDGTAIEPQMWAFYAYGQYECNKTVNLSTSEPFYLKQVYTHK